MGKRIGFVALFLCVCSAAVWAIMPPDVYKKRIIKSPIKATAEVLSVKVIKTEKAWVQKLVWFKLFKSYGSEDPGKKFAAYCYSQGDQPMVGGKIYYYPQAGEKVYVTALGKNMEITSYTPLSEKLQLALDKSFDKVKPGVGRVTVEQ